MRVVVAMSGGVDSTVACLKLKERGEEVIGITMKTWPSEECGQAGDRACCSLEALQYARGAAEDIGVPHYVTDLSREFISDVRDHFMEEYARGRTPNPCIYCNSRMKFGHLMRKAKELGADAVSTGHYARITFSNGEPFLREALDSDRDQSYFLCGIPKDEMADIFFPLGEMTKAEVRKIAADNGFMSADRKSSQDICFTSPGSDYRKFLEEKGCGGFIPGDMVDTSGRIVGKHRGVGSYTVGQRKGLGLGLHFPLYVTAIDNVRNTVTVGKKEHVMKTKIRVKVFNWLLGEVPRGPSEFSVRIRHGAKKVPAVFSPVSGPEGFLDFNEKQFAPTPGQAAVFYSGDIVAGGAWIEEVLD